MENAQSVFVSNLFQFELGNHSGKKIIWVKFPKDFQKLNILKKVTKPRWSNTAKCWYVTDTTKNRELFGIEKEMIGIEAFQKISPVNLSAMKRFQEHLKLKGFSTSTYKTYSIEFAQLLYMLKDYPVENLSAEKLRSYILYCHESLKLSENQIHSRMNALKFYFEKVLGRERMFFEIPRPKKPQKLPKALNQEEIKKIIEATENIKHKLIIQLSYGMGLRVSEIVNLKIEDIDSVKMKVFIERAKGKKDRYANLPKSILKDLRLYYKEHQPKKFLFEGKYSERYSIRSAQQVFNTAMNKAGIKKTVGIHALRHSYATHLLEYGTDISLIQKLLGHNDIKTTLVYTNVANKQISNIESPLDKF